MARSSPLVLVPLPQFILSLKVPSSGHFNIAPTPHLVPMSCDAPSKNPTAISQSSKGGLSILLPLVDKDTFVSPKSCRILLQTLTLLEVRSSKITRFLCFQTSQQIKQGICFQFSFFFIQFCKQSVICPPSQLLSKFKSF